jgi:hypothetical protein
VNAGSRDFRDLLPQLFINLATCVAGSTISICEVSCAAGTYGRHVFLRARARVRATKRRHHDRLRRHDPPARFAMRKPIGRIGVLSRLRPPGLGRETIIDGRRPPVGQRVRSASLARWGWSNRPGCLFMRKSKVLNNFAGFDPTMELLCIGCFQK